MKKLVTLAAVMLLPAALAGCASSDDSNGNGSKESRYTATTAKPSGDLDILNWGAPYSEPTTLDWIYSWDYGPNTYVLANLCEGLTRQNPDGSTSPALASEIQMPNDTTYVFKLQQGVTFTDGKPVTAEDVAWSLSRNMTASPASYWGLWYENVKSIKATAADEVTVDLKQPDALFRTVMSTPAGYVAEKAYVEAKGAKYGTAAGGVMCTGPFSLDSWNKGQNITLKRNDNYWDDNLKAHAAKVVINFIPDPSAMNSALSTGELDGASGLNVGSLKALEGVSDGKLYVNRGTEVVTFQFNDLTTGPLKDLKIREALRDAIDYDGIAKGVLNGYGAPAKNSTPEASWGYSQSIFRAGYDALTGGKQDLDSAKKLIEEAGGAPSEPIVVAVNSDDPTIVNAVTTIQDSAKSVGLDMEIKKLPAAEFSNLFFDKSARKGVNAMVNNVTVDVPDPLELYIQVIPGSPYNYTGLPMPDLVTALTNATKATDDDERAQLTVDAGKIINDQVTGLALYSLDARLFLNKKVTGAPVSTLSQWYYPWAATVGAS